MPSQYLFVTYRTKDQDPRFGKTKGQVIEVAPPRHGENNRGKSEGDWLGHTKMQTDFNLFNCLMTGQNTVDPDQSSHDKISVSAKQDIFRMEASKYVTMNEKEWNKSPYYQKPANRGVYIDYTREFLDEFTRLTQHIPTNQLIKYFPHAWVFPSKTEVFVGRDGVAINFNYPRRPDKTYVTVDTSKILDNMLLPHLENKSYTSSGPNSMLKSICSDSNYVMLVGKEQHATRLSHFGNPDFIITQQRFHGFWDNMWMSRNYLDGVNTEKHFKLVEFFGNISKSNFTLEKARSRARLYATKWIANKVSNSKIDSSNELRSVINEFRALISQSNTNELELESFLDKYPWILERGLGYKKYHSQVTVSKNNLSRSEHDIRPDKFLERNDGYCDILDLKRPDATVLITKMNRAHASAKLTEAEAQIDNYVNFTKEPDARNELRSKGINVLNPDGVVLIGRTPTKKMDNWEDIKNRLQVKTYTYDDLVSKIDIIVSWVEEIAAKINQKA